MRQMNYCWGSNLQAQTFGLTQQGSPDDLFFPMLAKWNFHAQQQITSLPCLGASWRHLAYSLTAES